MVGLKRRNKKPVVKYKNVEMSEEDKKEWNERRKRIPCKCGHMLMAHGRIDKEVLLGCSVKNCKCTGFEVEL